MATLNGRLPYTIKPKHLYTKQKQAMFNKTGFLKKWRVCRCEHRSRASVLLLTDHAST